VVPTSWTGWRSDFFGVTQQFPGLLAAALELLKLNVDAVQADSEAADAVLHGSGFEGDGTILTVGSGLTCRVGSSTADHYWIAGRRYAIATVGGEIASLPASSRSYLYMDATGAVTAYSAPLSPIPSTVWYCGTAVTGGTTCTLVDDSTADRVSSVAALSSIAAQLVAAVGLPYLNESTLDARVAILEAGGGDLGDPVSWAALQKQYGVDPTSILQQIAADLAAHVTAYHAAAGDDNASIVEVNLTRWNAEATRNGRLLLLICRTLNPAIFEHLEDCAAIVWGVYGDGTNGSPNNVDASSTWTYTP
jgi:hypothetical protein